MGEAMVSYLHGQPAAAAVDCCGVQAASPGRSSYLEAPVADDAAEEVRENVDQDRRLLNATGRACYNRERASVVWVSCSTQISNFRLSQGEISEVMTATHNTAAGGLEPERIALDNADGDRRNAKPTSGGADLPMS